MTITITAFANSPDKGQGLARDMRVRWALGEAGQTYEMRLLSMEALKLPEHCARSPFGQIPTYEEGPLILSESGAIVLHIAERHPGLLPADPVARARAVMWIFAALNTIEPPIVELETATYAEPDKPWQGEHKALIVARIRERLQSLSDRLGASDWLESEFSAGDLMMVMVLRRLDETAIVGDYPNLAAYVSRGEARPAYQRAFAAQHAVYKAGGK